MKKSVLMEYLQCTLCMEDMQRSCILQCHHSFCVDCLTKYIAQATDPQKMTCPICRKVTTLSEGDLTTLPPNFFMDNLKDLITKETNDDIDMIEKDKASVSADREALVCSLEDCQGEAVMYCTVDQEYLCQTCADEHAAGRFTRKHKTVSVDEAEIKMKSSTSHHHCGRHSDYLLDMYCKVCDKIICHECFNSEHSGHHITTLHHFIKPCEERLNTIMKRIDKLLKCVDLVRQTSQQQLDKAQHHIVSLKTQVTSTFTQIRAKLVKQEERLMSDIETAAARVDKVALSTQDEQQLAEVHLESLRFLGRSLTEGDVYDQMSNLSNLEEAVEKRWRREIPGVVWKAQDKKKINMSDVDHLTLTETSHTTSVLPCLEEGALNVTGAVCDKPDQLTSQTKEYREITRFTVGGFVNGICYYNNTIFTAKGNDSSLYMYSSTGVLIKKHVIQGMNYPYDLTLMSRDDGDKLIITDYNTKCLHLVPVKTVGDKCELGTTQSQKLSYNPHAVDVINNDNLVVTDYNGQCLHVYDNSGQNICTMRLPSGVNPLYLSADPSGGYVITGNPSGQHGQIIWVDEGGNEKKRHQDTACGISLSTMHGIVRDRDSRYIVAGYGNNQLLLFSRDGESVRCLVKEKIMEPYSLFLDRQQNKLYVGTQEGEVVIYDYYMLLGEQHPVKYVINTLSVKVKAE